MPIEWKGEDSGPANTCMFMANTGSCIHVVALFDVHVLLIEKALKFLYDSEILNQMLKVPDRVL